MAFHIDLLINTVYSTVHYKTITVNFGRETPALGGWYHGFAAFDMTAKQPIFYLFCSGRAHGLLKILVYLMLASCRFFFNLQKNCFQIKNFHVHVKGKLICYFTKQIEYKFPSLLLQNTRRNLFITPFGSPYWFPSTPCKSKANESRENK